jgi:hypothetical protein
VDESGRHAGRNSEVGHDEQILPARRAALDVDLFPAGAPPRYAVLEELTIVTARG